MAPATTAAAAALLLVAGCGAAPPSALGPGAGPWRTDRPEAHGLSTAGLKLAAQQVAEMAPLRQCFLVVKDGAIVHEEYVSSPPRPPCAPHSQPMHFKMPLLRKSEQWHRPDP